MLPKVTQVQMKITQGQTALAEGHTGQTDGLSGPPDGLTGPTEQPGAVPSPAEPEIQVQLEHKQLFFMFSIKSPPTGSFSYLFPYRDDALIPS